MERTPWSGPRGANPVERPAWSADVPSLACCAAGTVAVNADAGTGLSVALLPALPTVHCSSNVSGGGADSAAAAVAAAEAVTLRTS